MIRSHISIIGISLSILSLYSCNYGNKSSDVHDSEKSRSYIKFNVNFLDDSTSTASSSRSAREIYSFAAKTVDTYTINVSVKCAKGLSSTEDFEETFDISQTDEGIPVVQGKDCDLTFNSFTLVDKFEAAKEETKLKLELKYNSIDSSITATAAKKVGHYTHTDGTTTNKYINGSKDKLNNLNIYIANAPEQVEATKEEKTITSTEIKTTLSNLEAPENFPLKVTKFTFAKKTPTHYYNISHTTPTIKDWPKNCKIIKLSDLPELDAKEWDKVNIAYNNSKDVCSNIDLNKINNWNYKKDNIQYIILATYKTDLIIHNAYRVIKIPKIE